MLGYALKIFFVNVLPCNFILLNITIPLTFCRYSQMRMMPVVDRVLYLLLPVRDATPAFLITDYTRRTLRLQANGTNQAR